MKKLCKVLMLCLCLLVVPVTVAGVVNPVTSEAAAKEGLKKEKGKYYFYVKGKKVANKWKTVKGYRYYFGKNGAAYMAKAQYGINTSFVMKKIGSKYYGFDTKARMIKGAYVDSKGLIRYFNKNGVYNTNWSKNLAKANVYGGQSAQLKKLLKKYLGEPKKITENTSCYPNPPGTPEEEMINTDISYEYPNFTVSFGAHKDAAGVIGFEKILGAEPK